MGQTLQDLIEEALAEAKILECAREVYDEEHVLYVAQKLSGAPASFIEKVHSQSKKMQVAC